jgi:hypothetical protein
MYAKLFASILDSSLWSENPYICKLFVTMLAMADVKGYIFASRPGLAHRARMPREETDAALERLLSPDPDSSDKLRNPENEGRRVEEIDGGWRLLNFTYYRDLKDADERREQFRQGSRRYRAKKREAVTISNHPSTTVNERQHPSTGVNPSEEESEEAQSKSKKERVRKRARFQKPTFEEIVEWVKTEHPEVLPDVNPEVFASKFLASNDMKGWVVGTTHTPMKNWHAAGSIWLDRRKEGEFR